MGDKFIKLWAVIAEYLEGWISLIFIIIIILLFFSPNIFLHSYGIESLHLHESLTIDL